MDQTDIDLLHLLQENARMTVSELSKTLSLSRPSITERSLQLQERGVIEGFSARISPAKVGKDTILMIQISDLKVSITEYVFSFSPLFQSPSNLLISSLKSESSFPYKLTWPKLWEYPNNVKKGEIF